MIKRVFGYTCGNLNFSKHWKTIDKTFAATFASCGQQRLTDDIAMDAQ